MPSAEGDGAAAGEGAASGAEGAASGGAAGEPLDFAALGPGVWVELSVAADIEAVEAVSEILTRFAPGGTSVEPGFGLTNEGLGAVVDPTKPAIVRAYLPGLDPAGVRMAIAQATIALGHLQAFGLRPIGELQTSLVREADWAEAWKSHFPVLRVGRRMVVRPTWRHHRRQPGDVVLSLDPGMAFGTGLHPTTRLCLEALETLADEGLLAHGRAPDGTAECGARRGGARGRCPTAWRPRTVALTVALSKWRDRPRRVAQQRRRDPCTRPHGPVARERAVRPCSRRPRSP